MGVDHHALRKAPMTSLKYLLLPLAVLTAGAADTPASYRNVIGKTIVEEHFDTDALPKAWTAAKGTWAVVEGALEGSEKPEDQHNAVYSSKQTLPATLVMKADLRFDGASAMALLFNGSAGHVCRVTFTPTGFTLTGDKDKKDETDKAAVLAKVDQQFTKGEWYHVTIEITGDEMLAWTDATHVGYGRNAKIARDKTTVGISLAKQSGRIDNIVISAAEPDANWAEHRTQLGLR
jgi:hypothetical protein